MTNSSYTFLASRLQAINAALRSGAIKNVFLLTGIYGLVLTLSATFVRAESVHAVIPYQETLIEDPTLDLSQIQLVNNGVKISLKKETLVVTPFLVNYSFEVGFLKEASVIALNLNLNTYSAWGIDPVRARFAGEPFNLQVTENGRLVSYSQLVFKYTCDPLLSIEACNSVASLSDNLILNVPLQVGVSVNYGLAPAEFETHKNLFLDTAQYPPRACSSYEKLTDCLPAWSVSPYLVYFLPITKDSAKSRISIKYRPYYAVFENGDSVIRFTVIVPKNANYYIQPSKGTTLELSTFNEKTRELGLTFRVYDSHKIAHSDKSAIGQPSVDHNTFTNTHNTRRLID